MAPCMLQPIHWENEFAVLKVYTMTDHFIMISSGGSKGGGARDARFPPLAPNFFIFMQFSGKIGQIIG